MLPYHSNWYLIYAPDFSGACTPSLSLTAKKVRGTGEERRQNDRSVEVKVSLSHQGWEMLSQVL